MVNDDSLNDLYQKALPAITTKENHLHSLGYYHITKKDIWDYCIDNLWDGKEIGIDIIVNDIINVPSYSINDYCLNKLVHHDDDIIFEDLL